MPYKEAIEVKGLANLRKKMGLTQAQLAKEMSVEMNTVWKWENTNITPSIEMAKCLAAFFNVSVDYILNGPTPNEIQVRILIKESLDEMEVIDLSKDAPYLETVTLTPNKNSVTVVFDGDKTLGDAIEKILLEKEKIEKARAELFGENHSAA
jgi:transcriptional regulator with XRE-family HTH domain